MTVVLDTRHDLDLARYRAVAWEGSPVRLSAAALERIDGARASFLRLLDAEPELVVYGVTSGYGQNASQRLSPAERREHAARPPLAAATAFGEPVPERVARGIVFARLANFVDGHAAVSAPLAQAVAALLDGDPLPPVPSLGNQGAGEIVALSHLLGPLAGRYPLAEKEALALINGSPCASALLADGALAARARLDLALDVFALSAEALLAPHEAWDAALEDLWNDAHQATVLADLRERLAGGAAERRPYQAPVSWRILPRVLGEARRALATAEGAATAALAAVTDNPVYMPPDAHHPHGRVLASGGFHDATAPATLDALAAAQANLALLAERQASKLLDARVSLLPEQLRAGDGYLGCVAFGAADCAERARNACTPTLLPASEGGGFGQNDVASPAWSAWEKLGTTGRMLEATLAILAVIASQALHVTGRDAPPPLAGLLARVRTLVPPMVEQRSPGPELDALVRAFGSVP